MSVPVEDLFLHLSMQGAEARRLFLARSIFNLFQGTIGYGPLQGFRLEAESSWNTADLGSKIFGMYEKEVLELLITQRGNHDVCINIGAADGYYGVGLVCGGLFSRSVCYEVSESGRLVIAKTAQLNHVAEKVEVRGLATSNFPDELLSCGIALSRCLVMADIEGNEFELFDDICIKKLRHSSLLIELHEYNDVGGEQCNKLLDRLSSHFRLTFVTTGARNPAEFPELARLCDTDRWLLCSEGRNSVMRWVFCQPLIAEADVPL